MRFQPIGGAKSQVKKKFSALAFTVHSHVVTSTPGVFKASGFGFSSSSWL